MKPIRQKKLFAFGNTKSVHFLSRTISLSEYFNETIILSDRPGVLNTEYWRKRAVGIKLVSLPHGKLVRFKFYIKLIFGSPSLVFLHGGFFSKNSVTNAITRICKLLRSKVLLHIMGSEVLQEDAIKNAKRIISLSSHIIAKNEHLREALIRLNAPASKIIMCPWGIDNTIFNSTTSNVELSELYIEEDVFVFFSPRILSPFYRIFEIVKAFNQVKKIHSHLLLIITEYLPDKIYKDQIVEFINVENLESSIKFIDNLDPVSMATLYRRASCTVMYPLSDGLPQSLLESLACGTPVVGPAIPPYTDILQNKDIGLLVDSQNTNELYSCMLKAVEHYSQRSGAEQNQPYKELFIKYPSLSQSTKELIRKIYS